MGKEHLREFEEVVLLTVAILGKDAYGVAIGDEIESRLNRFVSLGTLQVTLKKLEDKKYLISHFGESTPTRGGRRRRYYALTADGRKIISLKKDETLSLWKEIKQLHLGNS